MSLADQSLPAREADHSSKDEQPEKSYTDSVPRRCETAYSPSSETYDQTIFDDFYMDDGDMVAPSPKRTQKAPEAPALPPRSALRASKLLDSFSLNLSGPVDTAEMSQATPHDFYLSSEEDASSSADDFSDYDYESGSEDADSPTRRKSHEDTARVVSVIYSGKPSIIDLSSIRRSISPSSIEARRRAAAASSESLQRRPSTPASSISSIHHPPRKSSMLTTILSKQKPTFLKIDPYANGSTYSLEPLKNLPGDDDAPRTPRTPTALMQGVSRTLSLVRKRSRPILSNLAAAKSKENLEVAIPRDSAENGRRQEDDTATLNSVRTTQPRVTYGDIMRMVKKNSQNAPNPPLASQEAHPASPMSPTGAMKGFLGNLAARRRSIKSTGRLI